MQSAKHDDRHPARLNPNLNDPTSHIFYHAPALILISATVPGPWAVQDCTLAAENLMLSAYDRGLGSCWIGCAQGFLNSAQGKFLTQLPDGWTPVAPIIIGHAAHFPPETEREDPEIRWIN
jgi:nitroreductase